MSPQLADCRAEAERRGWAVADEYVDDDVSASSGKRRPEYARMFVYTKPGDIVLLWHKHWADGSPSSGGPKSPGRCPSARWNWLATASEDDTRQGRARRHLDHGAGRPPRARPALHLIRD